METSNDSETPNNDARNASTTTPGQNRKHRHHHHQPATPTSCCSMQCVSCVRTPPAKRFHRVRNPFESALADRLHLPIIGSPSLFQCTDPPQLSSTHFEWTIDHVSSLNPAHVEPHETQFQDSPNPELEAKAQSAISSFFKDQQIVPSPVDCPLRNHRIILSELNSNTPISKPGRRIRDCGTQTELTLPVELPAALEEALRPYFRTEAICHSASRSPRAALMVRASSSTISADVSLRRKLFDMHNVVVIGDSGPADLSQSLVNTTSTTNSSPLSVRSFQRVAFVGKLSDSPGKSSFGSLSPISATSNSPHTDDDDNQRKTRLRDFLNEMDGGELSPIVGLKRERSLPAKSAPEDSSNSHSHGHGDLKMTAASLEYRSNTTVTDMSVSLVYGEAAATSERFTPDCSSSPMFGLSAMAEQTIDGSFNVKVSRLMMNSSKAASSAPSTDGPGDAADPLDDTHDDTMDDGLMLADDEDILMSQSNSSNSDTPRSKRRSASRKNLSQSFCRNWEFDVENIADIVANVAEEKRKVAATVLTTGHEKPAKLSERCGTAAMETEQQLVKFFRTDSGFNDMTSSQSSASNMQCCETLVRSSTPSKELAHEGDTSSSDF